MSFDHTFVVCAYKESPYIEECIKSLLSQTKLSKIKITTSTPSPFSEQLAARFNLDYVVNDATPSIGSDWNFAYDAADTQFVTICHQDDLYYPEYLAKLEEVVTSDPLILFSDYEELRNGARAPANINLKIKQLLLLPLRSRKLSSFKFVKRAVLSLGSPICCPAVTYNKSLLGDFHFSELLKCDLDWDAWERISIKKGSFVYIPKILMAHRIHVDSETTKLIAGSVRTQEDLLIFRRFWHPSIAKIINKIYRLSEKNN